MNPLDPPAIVSASPQLEARAKVMAKSFRIAAQPLRVWFNDNIHALVALWDELPHGGKISLVRDMGGSLTTVKRWIANGRRSNGPNGPIDPFSDSLEEEAAEGLASTGMGSASVPKQSEIETVVENGPPKLSEGIQATPNPVPEAAPAGLPKGWKLCQLCRAKPGRNSALCPECIQLNKTNQPDMFFQPPPRVSTAPTAPVKPPKPLLYCVRCTDFGPVEGCADCASLRKPPEKPKAVSLASVETHLRLAIKESAEVAYASPEARAAQSYLEVVSTGDLFLAAIERWKEELNGDPGVEF